MQDLPTLPEYKISLTANEFLDGYTTLRNATSNDYTYGEKTYRSVDKSYKEYAYVSIKIPECKTLTLIVNLEFYYVYGFVIDSEVYCYGVSDPKEDPKNGECYKGLKATGFSVPDSNILPFGDAYYEIGNKDQRLAVEGQQVAIKDIIESVEIITDTTISWQEKREDLLRVFWSLVEGIRFCGISNVIHDLLLGSQQLVTYSYFYYMAERWAELSIGAAYTGKVDNSIAVYELHRLHIPKPKEE